MKTFLKRMFIWQILHFIHFICERVCKHCVSITNGSRKCPTWRVRFQLRPRLQAATLTDWSAQCCFKSSSSFGSMAIHSWGVLPPPTVYLVHMGDESVLLYIYTKKYKKNKIIIIIIKKKIQHCNAPSISEDQSPSFSWRCMFLLQVKHTYWLLCCHVVLSSVCSLVGFVMCSPCLSI